MKRYLCIHGHFYQPPRENPWLNEIEVQDSASPSHDWNEKILGECYAPNAAARLVDNKNRILSISNNYRHISFNFGPTLLSWIQKHSPVVYQAILDADHYSLKERGGHGNAIAQVYNHVIMPLASRRDKWLQIQWGIRDFQIRFQRFPEGMWLSETAVDTETLELLAEAGIRFTILAPHQASQIKKISGEEWMDVMGGKIDPTLPYRCFLPNGLFIDIFFYDGPISNSIAFEKILISGDLFINRLLSGFSDERVWAQIVSVATDGESYGHHFKFGDMALAYVLSHIKDHDVELINYGQYLELFPPQFQVQIIQNTSWSCSHGIERWRGDCGCNSGKQPEWNQAWRAPLRQALNRLKERVDAIYESQSVKYINDPWNALKDYIDIIIDRAESSLERFFSMHQIKTLERSKRVHVLKLMEMERFSQIMFTSCGWFFDDVSGLEAVQILKYAARTIQLAKSFTNEDLEGPFVEKLSDAKSNIPAKGTGKNIYQEEVLTVTLDLKKVLSHYAISSLFEDYAPRQKIYCFSVEVEDFKKCFRDGAGLAIGKIRVTNQITQELLDAQFAVLHTNRPVFLTYIKEPPFTNGFIKLLKYHFWKFNCGKIDILKKSLDKNFQLYTLSLKDLFLDERRKIAQLMNKHILQDFNHTYRRIYEEYKTIMDHFLDMDIPAPQGFKLAAEYCLAQDLKKDIEKLIHDKNNIKAVRALLEQSCKWQINPGKHMNKEAIKDYIELLLKRLSKDPFDESLLTIINTLLDVNKRLKMGIETWQMQNIFYNFFYINLPKYPDAQIRDCIKEFKILGTKLNFFMD